MKRIEQRKRMEEKVLFVQNNKEGNKAEFKFTFLLLIRYTVHENDPTS